MSEQLANNAVTTLANDCAEGDGTITVTNAANFPPTPSFRILVASDDFSDPEVMKVTNISGNVFTVERAVEPTAGVQTAFAHLLGSSVAQSITKGGLTDFITTVSLSVAAEVPTGTLNGVNTVFTLTAAPLLLVLFLNGLLQTPGSGNDFVLAGSTITMNNPPAATDTLSAILIL